MVNLTNATAKRIENFVVDTKTQLESIRTKKESLFTPSKGHMGPNTYHPSHSIYIVYYVRHICTMMLLIMWSFEYPISSSLISTNLKSLGNQSLYTKIQILNHRFKLFTQTSKSNHLGLITITTSSPLWF